MTSPSPSRLAQIMRNLRVSGKLIIPIIIVTALLSGLRAGDYSAEHLQSEAPPIVLTLLLAWLGGAALGPAVLHWLPGESFTFKGMMAGILALTAWPAVCMPLHLTPLDVTMAILIIPATSALLTIRFASLPGRTVSHQSPSLLVAPIAFATGIWIMARFI